MRQQLAWARLVLVGLFCSMSLVAQQRTFVSTTGVDTNPCLLQSPCRSFDAAVASGGEVIVLDSGGDGPFTIGEPVSIVAPAGIYAGVSAFSGTAVHIDVAGAQPVAIRGLTLVGLGGAIGIDIAESQGVVIERVDVSGFSAHGVSARSGNHSIERSTFTAFTETDPGSHPQARFPNSNREPRSLPEGEIPCANSARWQPSWSFSSALCRSRRSSGRSSPRPVSTRTTAC